MDDVDHRCRRLPAVGRGRRSAARPGADAVEFARHRSAHVGRAGGALRAKLPAGALRPARPRQIRRAGRPLRHGAARPRCAGDRRCAAARANSTGAGFPWAPWRGCGSPPMRRSGSTGWCLPTPRAIFADPNIWNEGIKAIRARGLAALAERILALWFSPQFRASAPEAVAAMRPMLLATRRSKVMRRAARRSATWTIATCSRASARRRW